MNTGLMNYQNRKIAGSLTIVFLLETDTRICENPMAICKNFSRFYVTQCDFKESKAAFLCLGCLKKLLDNVVTESLMIQSKEDKAKMKEGEKEENLIKMKEGEKEEVIDFVKKEFEDMKKRSEEWKGERKENQTYGPKNWDDYNGQT